VMAAGIAIGCAFRFTADPASARVSGFVPFGFLRWNVEPQWWPYSWAILYLWAWAFAAVRIAEERIHTLGGLARACAQRKLLDVEFLFVVALVGALPGLLTGFSATYFFSEYHHWPAVALLLSMVVSGRLARSALRQSSHEEEVDERPGLSRLGLGRIALAVVVLSIVGTLCGNTAQLLSRMVAANLAARGRPTGQTGLGLALMGGRLSQAAEILRQTAADVEARMKTDKKIVAALSELDAMPLAEKRRSLLFIPKSNRQYWELVHGPYWPKDGPLVAPALSGVAMIDGLYMPAKDDPWLGYGYHTYSKEDASRPQPPLSQNLPLLRRQSAQRGFSQLIVIDSDANGPSLRKYECP
jgi:hypothetical protein